MNPNGYEIERKFLIEMPSPVALTGLDRSEITQTYLISKDKTATERVRQRSWGERVSYTHTIKHRISDFTREELEREISQSEYTALLEGMDRSRRQIQKTRYCLNYDSQIFEIDIYPFWDEIAIMEIELPCEDSPIDFPPFIKLIREVSGDGRYTNASLALSIPEQA